MNPEDGNQQNNPPQQGGAGGEGGGGGGGDGGGGGSASQPSNAPIHSRSHQSESDKAIEAASQLYQERGE